jgi:N-acetylmuramoyl-L-alanine amidase
MYRSIRAAGFAAALPVAMIGAVYAGPSRAWEAPPTVASSYLDHAVAHIEGGDLSVNDAAPEPVATAAPEPVAAHSAESAVSAPAPRPLAELVADHMSTSPADAEHECLAGAVYFEAKGESLQGQLSVAEVVLNRARSGRFPASVCGVVKQRGQFSFIRGGGFPPIARASAAWRKAVAVAHIAREELAEGAAPRALFFHARYVSPGWRGLTRVAAVGNHIFYR